MRQELDVKQKKIMTLSAYIKSTLFSEYGHVLYQIKGNEAYNNMLANGLLFHTPVRWGQNVCFFLFYSSSVEHYASFTLCTP